MPAIQVDSSASVLQSMFAAQIGLLGIQLIWTRDSEVALKNAKTDRKVRDLIFFIDFVVGKSEIVARRLAKRALRLETCLIYLDSLHNRIIISLFIFAHLKFIQRFYDR